MIESRFWKKDLLSHAMMLKNRKEIRRWSEKAQVEFEKEIIVSFFKIRKLIESNKISRETKEARIPVTAFPRTDTHITNLNYWDIDEVYDFRKPKAVEKSITFLSNQLIHSLIIYAFRKNKRWDHILTCSDYEKSKQIFQLTIENIVEILELIGNDKKPKIIYTHDDNLNDFKINVY